MKHVLKLFVSGSQESSIEAVSNLEKLRESHLGKGAKIEIIDIAENPRAALENNIVVVPMLIMSAPEPGVTIIGSLRDTEKVLRALRVAGGR